MPRLGNRVVLEVVFLRDRWKRGEMKLVEQSKYRLDHVVLVVCVVHCVHVLSPLRFEVALGQSTSREAKEVPSNVGDSRCG